MSAQNNSYTHFVNHECQPSPQNEPTAMGFSDKTIRTGFILRIFIILFTRLLVTLGLILLFVLNPNIQYYTVRHPHIMTIIVVIIVILVGFITFSKSALRSSPTNVILLGLLTIVESILVSFIGSIYAPNIVLMTVVVANVLLAGLILSTFQRNYKFSVFRGFLWICIFLMTVGSLIGVMFFSNELTKYIISCAIAATYSMYIVYYTQEMVSRTGENSLSPDEYISAALNF